MAGGGLAVQVFNSPQLLWDLAESVVVFVPLGNWNQSASVTLDRGSSPLPPLCAKTYCVQLRFLKMCKLTHSPTGGCDI